MQPRSRAIRFAVVVTALYALVMIPWPGLQSAYGRAFAWCAHAMVYRVWGNGPILGTDGLVQVRFDANGIAAGRDIMLEVANRTRLRGVDDVSRSLVSSRHLGYMPTVVLISLILATPLSWKRRGRALVWGVVFVHLFIVFRFGALILGAFCSDKAHGLYVLGPFGTRALALFVDVLAGVPATAYVVPVFIWLAVTFRREDWPRLSGAQSAQPTGG